MSELRYFKPSEFRRCVPKCDISQMSPEFLQVLDEVRADCGIVFHLNSAFRSSAYDKAHGRSGRGFHTLGRAVDVRCFDSASRIKIISACYRHGLSCGISSKFIHIDNRGSSEGYPEPISFLY